MILALGQKWLRTSLCYKKVMTCNVFYFQNTFSFEWLVKLSRSNVMLNIQCKCVFNEPISLRIVVMVTWQLLVAAEFTH